MKASVKAEIKKVLIAMVKEANLPTVWITPHLERIVQIVDRRDDG